MNNNSSDSRDITAISVSTGKILVGYRFYNTSLYSLIITINGNVISASTPIQCSTHVNLDITYLALLLVKWRYWY